MPARCCFILMLLLLPAMAKVWAQGKKTETQHQQWYSFFGTVKLTANDALYTDYHHVAGAFWITRLGYSRQLPHNLQGTIGHSFAKLTVPGAANDDLKRSEHRPWLQLQLPTPLSANLSLSHRLRYETRILQEAVAGELQHAYFVSHRFRLQESVRFNLPKLTFESITPYLTLSEEIFLNFKDDHTLHVFDQNRLTLMLGAQYQNTRLQAGYMNRFVQRNITAERYTNNHTFVVWLFHNLHLRKQD